MCVNYNREEETENEVAIFAFWRATLGAIWKGLWILDVNFTEESSELPLHWIKARTTAMLELGAMETKNSSTDTVFIVRMPLEYVFRSFQTEHNLRRASGIRCQKIYWNYISILPVTSLFSKLINIPVWIFV